MVTMKGNKKITHYKVQLKDHETKVILTKKKFNFEGNKHLTDQNVKCKE